MYFTSGTVEYLKKRLEEHPNETMKLMQNNDSCLLVHETNGPSLFKEPRKYEVIDSSGNVLVNSGYAVFNHIPVTDEGRPLFEYQFKNRKGSVEKQPGFLAIRVLRPLNSDTYIIFTLWKDESSFKNWKSSTSFATAHSNGDTKDEIKHQKIFLRPSFVTKYNLYEEKDEE